MANDFQNSFQSKSTGYQQKGKIYIEKRGGGENVSESDIPVRISGTEYIQGETSDGSMQKAENSTEVERQIELIS